MMAQPSEAAEAKADENPELGPALPDTLAVTMPAVEDANVEATALPSDALGVDMLPGKKEILVPDGRLSFPSDSLTKSLKMPIASTGVWTVKRLATTTPRDNASLSIAIPLFSGAQR